eukprot:TRINITY_DN1024_c0_g1_i4.p1 TRINITY_DN1024_c0_g1~~TRINITY_DN1024_c0_g1_i4.p1  ORF type:complete len:644 (+),score=160.44 TRINITY_DN1024_c0_g1_i4:755-2686(+)
MFRDLLSFGRDSCLSTEIVQFGRLRRQDSAMTRDILHTYLKMDISGFDLVKHFLVVFNDGIRRFSWDFWSFKLSGNEGLKSFDDLLEQLDSEIFDGFLMADEGIVRLNDEIEAEILYALLMKSIGSLEYGEDIIHSEIAFEVILTNPVVSTQSTGSLVKKKTMSPTVELGKGLANPIAAFADTTLAVEKQTVSSHLVVLRYRVPNLLDPKDAKTKGKPKKKPLKVVVPASITARTLQDVLQYVYTGSVEIAKLSVPQILALNAAAKELDLGRLHWICEDYLKRNLGMDNIFTVLKGADALHQQSVKNFCFYFIVQSYNTFIGHKEAVKDLGIELFQEVVERFQSFIAGEFKAPEVPAEPPNTIVEDYKKVFDEIESTDIHFKVGMEYIPCHRAILASQSPELNNLCAQATVPAKGKEIPEHIILGPLKGRDGKDGPSITPGAFKSILQFCYYGDVNIKPLHAIEILPFAKDYQLPVLQAVCEDIVKQNIGKETALRTLTISYLPQLEDRVALVKELRRDSIGFILSNLKQVDLVNLKNLDPNIAIDILLERQVWDKNGGKALERKPKKEKKSKKEVKEKEPEAPKLESPPALNTPPQSPPTLKDSANTEPPKLNTPPELPLPPPPVLTTPPNGESKTEQTAGH